MVEMAAAHFGAPAPWSTNYSGVEATGVDGATRTAGCVPPEVDGAAAGAGMGAGAGAAALVSICAAGDGAATCDALASEAALAAPGAPEPAEAGCEFGSRCAVIVKWSCPQAAPSDKSTTIGIMYARKAQA